MVSVYVLMKIEQCCPEVATYASIMVLECICSVNLLLPTSHTQPSKLPFCTDFSRYFLPPSQVANFDEMSPLLRPPEVLAARPSTLDEFFDLESRIQRGELGEQALAHFEDFQV